MPDALSPATSPPTLIATSFFASGAPLFHYRLANGLNVYLLPEHAVPVVSVQTWVNVGSRHEVKGKTGLAHFFEHLMFGATDTLAEGEFTERLEAIGAEINAATFFDWTHYYVNARASALADVLDLEIARLAHLALTPAAIDREREVVANERRMCAEDNLLGGAMEQLFATAYTTHAYGHPVIGHMADIEAFNPVDCQAFYKAYYAPNNVTLVLVGDFEVDAALALVTARYAALAPAPLPLEDVRPEPPQTAERRILLVKPTATEKILIAYRGPSAADADAVPLHLLGEALTGGVASILHQALVETEMASQVDSGISGLRDPDLLEFYLDAMPDVTDLLARFDACLAAVVEAGIDDEALDRAKARMQLASAQALESASDRAEYIGHAAIVYGRVIPPAQWGREVARVTRSDVLRVARRYLTPASRTIVQILPSIPGADAPEETL